MGIYICMYISICNTERFNRLWTNLNFTCYKLLEIIHFQQRNYLITMLTMLPGYNKNSNCSTWIHVQSIDFVLGLAFGWGFWCSLWFLLSFLFIFVLFLFHVCPDARTAQMKMKGARRAAPAAVPSPPQRSRLFTLWHFSHLFGRWFVHVVHSPASHLLAPFGWDGLYRSEHLHEKVETSSSSRRPFD